MDSDDELAQAHQQSWHEENDLYDLLNIMDEIELAHSPEPPEPPDESRTQHEKAKHEQAQDNQLRQKQQIQDNQEPHILHCIAAKRKPNAPTPPKPSTKGYAPSMLTREDMTKKRTETPRPRGLKLFKRIAAPGLTPEGASAAGLIPTRPTSPKVPRRPVLVSSRLRQMRVFQAGSRCSSTEPSTRPHSSATWFDDAEAQYQDADLDSIGPLMRETPDLRKFGESRTPTSSPSPDLHETLNSLRNSPLGVSPSISPEPQSSTAPAVSSRALSSRSASPEPVMSLAGNVSGRAGQSTKKHSPSASVTASQPQAATSRPEAESVIQMQTESWTARMPSETWRSRQRQHRRKIVIANRPSSPVRLKTGSQRQSVLEERWIGNLDDPECDKELSPAAVLALLDRTEIYKNSELTREDVRRMILSLLNGGETSCVAKVSGRVSNKIDPIQFSALITKIAHSKGITYCECLDRLVNHQGATKTKLEHFFGEFAHGSAHGFMTVYEFTRFCQAYGLFSVNSIRFVEGDVHFLFLNGCEGKCVDLSGFKRVLKEVADKLQMRMQNLLHLMAERDAERASNAKGVAARVYRKTSSKFE